MHIRILISLLLVQLFFQRPTMAQINHTNLDSLKNILRTTDNDSTKARMLIRIGNALRHTDPQQALHNFETGLEIVKKLNWTKGFAIYYNDMGSNYNDQGIYDKALEYYQKSLDYSPDFPTVRILTLSNIAILYAHQENRKMARNYNEKVWTIAQKERLKEQEGLYYTNASLIEPDTLKKQQFLKKAIRVYTQIQDSLHLAVAYFNLGEVSAGREDRLGYYLLAGKIFERVAPRYSVAISTRIAVAEEQLRSALQDNSRPIHESKRALLDTAEQEIKIAMEIAEQTGSFQNLIYCYGVLSRIKKAKGDFEAALKYAEINFSKNDSLFSQENKNRIAALESQREIDQLDKQLAINQLQLSNARRTRIALLGGGVLLLAIGVLLLNQNIHRRRTNAELVALNAELHKANHIKNRFFGILSHDLRAPVSNLIHFLHLQKEAPDLLDAKTFASRQQKLSDSAEQLLETMETVLLWSKSQMEHFLPQNKTVQVADLFAYLQSNVPTESGIQISYDNPENISLHTDEDYLRTIMYNLTINAVKALKHSTDPQLHWSARVMQGEILISISDNGPGISSQQVEPLYNDQAAVETKHGLGFHIIRDLALAIQCKVSIDPQQKAGSCFILHFPAPLYKPL